MSSTSINQIEANPIFDDRSFSRLLYSTPQEPSGNLSGSYSFAQGNIPFLLTNPDDSSNRTLTNDASSNFLDIRERKKLEANDIFFIHLLYTLKFGPIGEMVFFYNIDLLFFKHLFKS